MLGNTVHNHGEMFKVTASALSTPLRIKLIFGGVISRFETSALELATYLTAEHKHVMRFNDSHSSTSCTSSLDNVFGLQLKHVANITEKGHDDVKST